MRCERNDSDLLHDGDRHLVEISQRVGRACLPQNATGRCSVISLSRAVVGNRTPDLHRHGWHCRADALVVIVHRGEHHPGGLEIDDQFEAADVAPIRDPAARHRFGG
jgi:hypothetical protein